MTQAQRLRELEEEMSRDELLPLKEANLVFGEGRADADVMFIGEAPGFYENQQGRPFVGRAGQLLDKLIENMGWRREDVYITNIIKRRPPSNRDPLPSEIESYKPYMEKQIAIIEPRVIVPLGRYAMNYFIPEGKISRDQGKLYWWHDALLMPLYHPAAALRRADLVNDIQTGLNKLPGLVSRYEELLNKHRAEKMDEPKEQASLFA